MEQKKNAESIGKFPLGIKVHSHQKNAYRITIDKEIKPIYLTADEFA